MPRLIKQGRIVEDDWQAPDPERAVTGDRRILTLEQWQELPDKAGQAVQLEPGQAPTPLFDFLEQIPLVAINFPVFTDGRGFSYARALRERGFKGELRACGHFIRDQLTYLGRCGFDAFQMAVDGEMETALASLADFDEYYQGSVDQPLPLFRRRNGA
jgi:uncharacterized protein (DUF934 family)